MPGIPEPANVPFTSTMVTSRSPALESVRLGEPSLFWENWPAQRDVRVHAAARLAHAELGVLGRPSAARLILYVALRIALGFGALEARGASPRELATARLLARWPAPASSGRRPSAGVAGLLVAGASGADAAVGSVRAARRARR